MGSYFKKILTCLSSHYFLALLSSTHFLELVCFESHTENVSAWVAPGATGGDLMRVWGLDASGQGATWEA